MSALWKDLAQLGVHEKLQLVEDLWDSIAAESMPPISDAVFEELERRSAWAKAHPGSDRTLEQIAQDLGVKP